MRSKFSLKIIITLVIAILMVFLFNIDGTIINNKVYAESVTTPEGIVFDTNTGVITGYSGNATTLDIPSSIDGFAVIEIGGAAFNGKNSLVNVNIPNSISKIDAGPFRHCSNLENINVSSENSAYKSVDGILYSISADILIRYPEGRTNSSYTIPSSVSRINDYAFTNCNNNLGIIIPSSVKSIGYGAFYFCAGITEIVIPDSVTSIEEYAFAFCNNLSRADISEKVIKIDSGVFYNTGLTSVTIPYGIKQIGYQAFESCENISNIQLPNSLLSIGEGSFSNCSGIKNLIIPQSVEKIGSKAFSGCKLLNNLIIPNNVKSIGSYAFRECDGLTNITLSSGLSELSEGLFAYCDNLSQMAIPDSVKTIKQLAFHFDTGLQNIVIPNSVSTIENVAFSDCSELKSVVIPTSVTSIGSDTFYNSNKLTIYGEVNSYAQTYANSKGITFRETEVPEEGINLKNASLYINDDTTNLTYLELMEYICLSQVAYEGLDFSLETVSNELSNHTELLNKRVFLDEGVNIKYRDLVDEFVGEYEIVGVAVQGGYLFVDKNSNQLSDLSSINWANGFEAVALKHPTENKVIIAFAGTEDLLDYMIDGGFALFNKLGNQFESAEEFSSIVENGYGGYEIIYTGHSLGGAFATHMSILTGNKAHTIDSAMGHTLDATFIHNYLEISNFEGIENKQFNNYTDLPDNDSIAFSIKPLLIEYKLKSDWIQYSFLNGKYHLVPFGKNNHNNGGTDTHSISSILKYSDGEFAFTEVKAEDEINPSSAQVINIPQNLTKLHLGTSSNNILKSDFLYQNNIIFGGSGNDTIYGTITSDKFVGGKGDDILDGNVYGDVYVYNKGDGLDTINDWRGNEKIVLLGFQENDVFTINDSSTYKAIMFEGDEIIKISKNRSNTWTNSVELKVGDVTKKIQNWNTWTDIREIIAQCPVSMEVYAPNGDLVIRLVNGQEGTWVNEHGYFYVSKIEGTDDFSKIAYVMGDDYTIKLIGEDGGTMNYSISELNDEAEPIKTVTFENVAVKNGTVVTSNSAVSGATALAVDFNNDGEIQMLAASNVADAPPVPAMESKTDTSITLSATVGYEYMCVSNDADISTGIWQVSNVFDALSQSTAYDCYQRVAETSTLLASPASSKLDVTTFSTRVITYTTNNGAGSASGNHSPSSIISLHSGDGFSNANQVIDGWVISGTEYKTGALFTMPEQNVTAVAKWIDDSDNDGVSDIDEIAVGTDPNDASDKPQIGTITGEVNVQNGDHAVGFEVVLNSTARTTATDANGRFVFAGVPLSPHTISVRNGNTQLGTYALSFKKAGINSASITDNGSNDSFGSAHASVNASFLTFDLLIEENGANQWQLMEVGYTQRADGTWVKNPKTGIDETIFSKIFYWIITLFR